MGVWPPSSSTRQREKLHGGSFYRLARLTPPERTEANWLVSFNHAFSLGIDDTELNVIVGRLKALESIGSADPKITASGLPLAQISDPRIGLFAVDDDFDARTVGLKSLSGAVSGDQGDNQATHRYRSAGLSIADRRLSTYYWIVDERGIVLAILHKRITRMTWPFLITGGGRVQL